ncbi:MAG TPA: DUF4175 domain-containing protein, partial [Polyangiaceae bacterium]|nr:DUF4175 domain-containing protein [Polyangiaceae bacterium]
LEPRRLRQPDRIVRRLVHRAAPESADRAIRALSLIGRGGEARADGTSAALARLHVARALAQLPAEQIIDRAARTAARLSGAALVGLVCVLATVVARAWSLLEGADVLAARRGTAPLPMQWLDDVDVVARPPDYLRETERHGLAFVSLGLPYGTLITVKGVPLHTGRRLLLSDGTTEVPFVEDGSGAVVARWQVTESTSLRVVARFGDVTIAGAEALTVQSVADSPPIVRLDGAPRQVLLVEQGGGDIPIKYEATDDHGLREVHLVLRSGTREERRVLARLDSETRTDKGGYVLKLRDAFLKKSHVPIEVTVEAKDNDPLTGPKWGASPAIVLVPPNVGEPESLRLDALRRLRDQLIDSLAWRLSNHPPNAVPNRNAFLAEETKRAGETDAVVAQTLAQAYAGIRVPIRSRATLLAQQQAVRKAVDRETTQPSAATHAEVVKTTERFALVVDAVSRGLGLRDSRDSALQLADVADDLAMGAAQEQHPDRGSADRPGRGQPLMDAATTVLTGGAQAMKRLGALGRDLGEIVDADLLRVKRSREAADLAHAELAARDLAARLREPDPSFGARGGDVGRAGGESGGARATPGDEEAPPEDVDRAFQEAAKDVEQLAQDHAGEVAKMDQALAGATSDDETEQLRQDSRRHAEAIREAASGLPSVGNGSDSWTSKGAAARELAEQMARSLEQARAGDALQSGRSALGALDEAKKMLQRGGWIQDPSGDGQRRVESARRTLDAEEKWVEHRLEQIRKQASQRARKQLEQGGDEEEKLADRARDLAQQGREHGSLPQKAVDSIGDAERAARQAAEALREGDGEKGVDRQHEAQRSLEAANEQLREEDEGSESPSAESPEDHQSHSNASRGWGNVPKPGKGPDEFRRRVVRGLGQPTSGALRDAVRRYAEGLLR